MLRQRIGWLVTVGLLTWSLTGCVAQVEDLNAGTLEDEDGAGADQHTGSSSQAVSPHRERPPQMRGHGREDRRQRHVFGFVYGSENRQLFGEGWYRRAYYEARCRATGWPPDLCF